MVLNNDLNLHSLLSRGQGGERRLLVLCVEAVDGGMQSKPFLFDFPVRFGRQSFRDFLARFEV